MFENLFLDFIIAVSDTTHFLFLVFVSFRSRFVRLVSLRVARAAVHWKRNKENEMDSLRLRQLKRAE